MFLIMNVKLYSVPRIRTYQIERRSGGNTETVYFRMKKLGIEKSNL